MSKVIALTGTSGAMGSEVLLSLMQSAMSFTMSRILGYKKFFAAHIIMRLPSPV